MTFSLFQHFIHYDFFKAFSLSPVLAFGNRGLCGPKSEVSSKFIIGDILIVVLLTLTVILVLPACYHFIRCMYLFIIICGIIMLF